MNVLHVIHHPVYGGAHNQALRLAPAFEDLGVHLTVLLPADPETDLERFRSQGVDAVALPLHRVRKTKDPRPHIEYAASFAREIKAIRELIQTREIDLVEVGSLINPHGGIAARREGLPVVWQIIDMAAPAMLRRVLRPVVTHLADALMFDGKALVEPHLGVGEPPLPTFVYFPPVETHRFVPSKERRARKRAELGIPGEAAVVGIVANVNPQKGIEVFIDAAARIRDAVPDAWFLVIGHKHDTHGDYVRGLERTVEQHGLDKLLFVGSQNDVESWYPAMDVKVISSVKWEGTTTTAMEAMSCGIPVVAADIGAVSEVVVDGRTGLLVPPSDPHSLADSCIRVLGDRDLAARMGSEGRQRAISHFDVSICARTHIDAFEAALARRGG